MHVQRHFDFMDGMMQVLAGFVGYLAVVFVQLRQGVLDEMLGVLEVGVGGLLCLMHVLVRRRGGRGRGRRLGVMRVQQVDRFGNMVVGVGAVMVVFVVGVIKQMLCLVQFGEDVGMRRGRRRLDGGIRLHHFGN